MEKLPAIDMDEETIGSIYYSIDFNLDNIWYSLIFQFNWSYIGSYIGSYIDAICAIHPFSRHSLNHETEANIP